MYEFNLKIAFEACPASVSNVVVKEPPQVKTIPKYVKCLTISNSFPLYKKKYFFS